MTQARRLVVEAEERGSWLVNTVPDQKQIDSSGTLVSYATTRFLADAGSKKGKNLAPPSLSKYRTILGRLGTFCDERHLKTIPDVTFEQLNSFRNEWPTGPQATANYIQKLRTFWKYCVRHKWCKDNVAGELDMPLNYDFTERMPFTAREMEAILNTASTIKFDVQQPVSNFEVDTFIRLMRYSGMAIADASLFQESELREDEIRYFRKKTKRRANRKLVVVPIPKSLVERLRALPLHGKRYFFCHGSDHLVSAVDVWHNRLRQVFDEAGVPTGTSHRFRHTFATDLLTQGVSIELVSRWLGHSSVKITERHYSHWIEERIGKASQVLRDIYANQ